MALIRDMQKTRVRYVGQYKGFKQIGPSTPRGDNMTFAYAISRLFTVFLLDESIELIIEEEDPGRNESGVHKSFNLSISSDEVTHDIRFVINRCFND